MSYKYTPKNPKVDICFILDATSSNQSIFTLVSDYFWDIAFNLRKQFRRNCYNYGAVVYRDPIDYIPIPSEISDLKEEEKMKSRQKTIEKLKKAGLYDEEMQEEMIESFKLYDKDAFPIDKNISIQFTGMENLMSKLLRVECDGGNDEPEDWAGALNLALNDLKWDEKSKKFIVWISDSNAHGKRFCGFDNHNEEEIKLKKLVENMFDQGINFLGINLIKNNNNKGCEMTLNEMKKIFDGYASNSDHRFSLNFFIKNLDVEHDESIYGGQNWSDELMENLANVISNELIKMIDS